MTRKLCAVCLMFVMDGNPSDTDIMAEARNRLTPAAGNFAQYSTARLYGVL
jgi:hypothetical protein